jgi:hypothetical protein
VARRVAAQERGEGHQVLGLAEAAASDLLLYLFRRRSAGALQVTGDVTVTERFALRTGSD